MRRWRLAFDLSHESGDGMCFTREIRQLQDLIPICAYCRKIRNDADYWQLAETYISEQTGSNFTHGMCPDCAKAFLAQGRAKDNPSAGS